MELNNLSTLNTHSVTFSVSVISLSILTLTWYSLINVNFRVRKFEDLAHDLNANNRQGQDFDHCHRSVKATCSSIHNDSEGKQSFMMKR